MNYEYINAITGHVDVLPRLLLLLKQQTQLGAHNATKLEDNQSKQHSGILLKSVQNKETKSGGFPPRSLSNVKVLLSSPITRHPVAASSSPPEGSGSLISPAPAEVKYQYPAAPKSYRAFSFLMG